MKPIHYILICCFLGLGCSKEETPEPAECTTIGDRVFINTCLHGYHFGSWSYWVYQDTNTFAIDSITRGGEYYSAKYGSYFDENCTYHGYITLHYKSSLAGYYYETLRGSIISLSNTPEFYFNCASNTMIDSLSSGGNMYYDVIRSDFSNKTYYMKDSIGIIRKVVYNTPVDTSTWDLIYYQTWVNETFQ